MTLNGVSSQEPQNKSRKSSDDELESWRKIADSNQQWWTGGLVALPHVSVTLPLRKPNPFPPPLSTIIIISLCESDPTRYIHYTSKNVSQL